MSDLRKFVIDTLWQSDGPVFIHSDLYRTSVFVERSTDRQQMLEAHLALLKQVTTGRAIWFPTFTYQFTKTGVYNQMTSLGEVGPLPEYVRQYKAEWRTLDPIFSACGTGDNPCHDIPTAAFGSNTVFAKLVKAGGSLIFYGAEFSAATIIHYTEQLGDVPYRYDKIFPGVIITPTGEQLVNYHYHVRPMATSLDYDWPKILLDLRGIIHSFNDLVYIIRANFLVEYWLEKLTVDPFYFLDETTRHWVRPMLDRLGRPFQLEDFE